MEVSLCDFTLRRTKVNITSDLGSQCRDDMEGTVSEVSTRYRKS